MSTASETRIELFSPTVEGNTVHFKWSVSPDTDIYRKNSFYLRFPDTIPLDNVPERLWWTVFITCIHPHWALLRPCKVHLPVQLAPGEAEVWTRLVFSYADTLDAVNHQRKLPRSFSMIEHGEPLPGPQTVSNKGLCAAAFSGGKDSIAQAGLLMEMGFKPMLVSTTSPMPGEILHVSSFRDTAMHEMQSRCGLELFEVESNLRHSWNNLVPRKWGYRLSMNEITDTLLYTATMAVCGYVKGASRLYLASENEVSENHLKDGVYLQLTHFMYSGLTQAGISALFEPFGMSYGSLNIALHSVQVQELVVNRFQHLSDLQCSCWKADDSTKACSICGECMRLAWASLVVGGSPASQGVNMITLLNKQAEDPPEKKKDESLEKKKPKPHPPNNQVSIRFQQQLAHAILTLTPVGIRDYLEKSHPDSVADGHLEQALVDFAKIQTRTRKKFPEIPAAVGFRQGYLSLLDLEVQQKLDTILSSVFEQEDPELYAEQLHDLHAAIDWVTQPLRNTVHQR